MIPCLPICILKAGVRACKNPNSKTNFYTVYIRSENSSSHARHQKKWIYEPVSKTKVQRFLSYVSEEGAGWRRRS